MTYTYTTTETITFTVTHAKYMASKVATDLKRLQRLYGTPADSEISNYEQEAVELLKSGYIDTVTYGFRRNGNWIEPTLRYTSATLLTSSATDDDPGRIKPGADISNATFYSYLSFSSAWFNLTSSDRNAVEQRLPFVRSLAPRPGVSGYFSNDLTYSSGGKALARASVRS